MLGSERSTDGGDASIVAHDIHCCRIEKEKAAIGRSKSEPPRRKRSDNVAVGECRHIALSSYRASSCNYAIGSSLNVIRIFAARASVGENHPAGPYGMDLLRS